MAFSFPAPSAAFKQVRSLTTGTFVAQLIVLASSPWIARIYTPEEFATYGLFASLVLVGSILITGGYEAAIPLPKEDSIATSLLRSVLLFCLVFAVTGTIIVASLRELIDPIWGLLPLAMSLHGAMQGWTQWTLRVEHIHRQAWSKVSMSAALVSTQVLSGRAGFGSYGLIGGYILGRVASIAIQQNSVKLEPSQRSFSVGSLISGFHTQWHALREYRQQPLFVMPSSLLSMGAKEVPVFLIAAWFSQESLGQYSFAYRILAAPATLLALSLGAIFTQRAAKRVMESKPLKNWVQRLWVGLAAGACLPFIGIGFFGESIFVWVFGEQWAIAGRLSQWLSIMLFLQFVSLPTSRVLMVIGAAKWQPIASGADLMVRMLALWVGYTQGGVFGNPGFLGAIQTMVIAQAFVQFGTMILIWVQVNQYDETIHQDLSTR
jgi:O-antigen/teichoic acid export membrane protein